MARGVCPVCITTETNGDGPFAVNAQGELARRNPPSSFRHPPQDLSSSLAGRLDDLDEPVARHPGRIPAFERRAAERAFEAAHFAARRHGVRATVHRPALTFAVVVVHVATP